MHNAALAAARARRLALPAAAGPARALRRDRARAARRRASSAPTSRSRTRRRRSRWPTRRPPPPRAIGAANTLTFAPDGAIAADNTDAPGPARRPLGDRAPAAARWCSARAAGARAVGLRAARRRARRRRGLEPHARARPRAGGRPRRRRPSPRRSPPTCSSTARRVGLHRSVEHVQGTARDGRCRRRHTRAWSTWSTGPAAPSWSQEARAPWMRRWSTASRSSSARVR